MAPKSNKKTKDTPGGNSSSGRVSPPTSGAKRKQGEADDEPERRVSQRTDEVVVIEEETNQEQNRKESMKKILQHDLWSTDTNVVVTAMKGLANMLYAVNDKIKMTERQKHFFFLGGHAVVVGIMNTHPDLKNLQYHGIGVLMNALCDNMELKEAIVEVEGFEAILSAMKKYHSDGGIQSVGTGALCNLLLSHEANTDLFVTKHDGIPFLLEQMEKFPNNAELIRRACGLLKIISLYDKFRKSLVDAKAVSVLARAFEHHKDNIIIREKVHIAIQNLTKE